MEPPVWRIGDSQAPVAPEGVTELAGAGWRGRFERMTFGAGFHMHLGRLDIAQASELPVTGEGEDPPSVSAYLLSAGRCTLSMAGQSDLALEPGRALLFTAEGGHGVFHLPGPQTLRFFSVAISPELFLSLLDGEAPPTLAPLVESRGRETVVRTHALSGPTRALVGELGEPGASGALQRLHREAVAMQLLSEVVGAEIAEPADASGLSRREDAAVRAAREQLLCDLRDAPPATQLAAAAGMALRRFLRAFEALHGESPAQLLRRERLAEARRLLEAGELPLKAIAWRVGYAHVSNFVAAFSAQHGDPPRRFSRRSLAAE